MTSTEIAVETADIHNELKPLVALAMDLGWTARNYTVRRKQGVVLRRMHEGRSIEVSLPPTKSLKDGSIQQLFTKVRRYSDDTQVAIKAAVTKQATDPNLTGQERAALMIGALPAGRELMSGETVIHGPAPTIISEAPRLARGGTGAKVGRFYESDAVIERRWSDGSSDFACSWEGCDFTSPQHLTVSSHYARSATHKLVPDPVIISGPSYLESDPRVDRLAEAIMEAADELGEGGFDARALAAKMIELRDAGRGEDDITPRELTAEERLERILRLADGGRYLTAVEENRQYQERVRLTELAVEETQQLLARATEQVDEALRVANESQAAASEALEQRDAARAEAETATGKWNSLRELVIEQ